MIDRPLEGVAAQSLRSDPSGPPALEAFELSKTFVKGKPALDHVDVVVQAGEIHGLLGQNGSGKSTFVKILSGYHAPDHGGRLRIGGHEVPLPMSAKRCRMYGLAFVHQDLGFIDDMSIQDNLRVGRYSKGRFGQVLVNADKESTSRLLEEFDLHYDPSTPVESLSAAERAILGIARAVDQVSDRNSGLLVSDEPTAALGGEGVRHVFDALRVAARRGLGVLIITHRMDEILEVTDRVTVLRDGRVVGRMPTSEATEERLIQLIVGDRLGSLYPEKSHSAAQDSARWFQVSSLRYGKTLEDVDFSAGKGEIVGLTGLQGSGFEDVPIAIGAREGHVHGSVRIGETEFHLGSSPVRARMRAGMAILPADRKATGGAMELTVRENVSMPRISEFFRKGFLRYYYEAADVEEILHEFMVSPPEPEARFGSLSGGNQQKAILGKWVKTRPSVLVLAEPTQGIDIGARKDVFRILRSLADAGTTLIIASNEYEDLAHLCDRVIIFQKGRISGELHGGDLSEEAIVRSCYV